MNKHSLFFIACCCLLCSCSTLTESQIKNINAFATAAKSYSGFPGEVFNKRAALHLNRELLNASQFTTPDAIEHRVNNARESYKTMVKLTDSFDLSLKLIQQYSGLLAKLSAENFVEDLEKSTKDLSENLSDLVKSYNAAASAKLPAQVGGGISRAIFLVGRRMTRCRQAKELKRFIPLGNELIQTTTGNLVEVLDADSFTGVDGIRHPSLKSLLQEEKQQFIQSYRNVVFSNVPKINYPAMQAYDAILTDFEHTELLRQKSVDAAKKLAKAHEELNNNIQSRKNLKEIIKETQNLIADVQELKKILSAALQAGKSSAQL